MFGQADVVFADPLKEPFEGDQVPRLRLPAGALTRSSISCTQRCSDHSVGGAAVVFQNDTQRRQVLESFPHQPDPRWGSRRRSAPPTRGRRARLTSSLGARPRATATSSSRGGERRGAGLGAPRGRPLPKRPEFEAPVTTARCARSRARPAGAHVHRTPGMLRERAGIDRDEDGAFDRDEVEAGSDPASVPWARADRHQVAPPARPGGRSVEAEGPCPIPRCPGRDGRAARACRAPRIRRSGCDARRVRGGPTSDVVTIAAGIAITARILKSYRFTGPSDGPIKRVVVGGDRITVKGGKALFAYTLDEPAQGSVAVQLALGDDCGWQRGGTGAQHPIRSRGTVRRCPEDAAARVVPAAVPAARLSERSVPRHAGGVSGARARGAPPAGHLRARTSPSGYPRSAGAAGPRCPPKHSKLGREALDDQVDELVDRLRAGIAESDPASLAALPARHVETHGGETVTPCSARGARRAALGRPQPAGRAARCGRPGRRRGRACR